VHSGAEEENVRTYAHQKVAKKKRRKEETSRGEKKGFLRRAETERKRGSP